ncbi:MAG: ABC transporter ATP-binding protein [Cytophagales bacterium]
MQLNVKSVSLSKSGNDLLKEIDFSFQPGKSTALIGPNGSGKTSLLNVISGLWLADSGVINYPFEKELIRTHLAFLPAKSVLSEGFSAKEVIAWGKPTQKTNLEVIREIANWFEVKAFLDKKVNQISEGEQKRIHLARVLYQLYPFQPNKVLLLDEPFAPLDPKHQLCLLSVLKNLKSNFGITIVIALHQLNLLKEFDMLIALKNGGVFSSGNIQESKENINLKKLYDIENFGEGLIF